MGRWSKEFAAPDFTHQHEAVTRKAVRIRLTELHGMKNFENVYRRLRSLSIGSANQPRGRSKAARHNFAYMSSDMLVRGLELHSL